MPFDLIILYNISVRLSIISEKNIIIWSNYTKGYAANRQKKSSSFLFSESSGTVGQAINEKIFNISKIKRLFSLITVLKLRRNWCIIDMLIFLKGTQLYVLLLRHDRHGKGQ